MTLKRGFSGVVFMCIFLLTTFNLHNYPQNPRGLKEILLFLMGFVIWLSPFIVYYLVNTNNSKKAREE